MTNDDYQRWYKDYLEYLEKNHSNIHDPFLLSDKDERKIRIFYYILIILFMGLVTIGHLFLQPN